MMRMHGISFFLAVFSLVAAPSAFGQEPSPAEQQRQGAPPGEVREVDLEKVDSGYVLSEQSDAGMPQAALDAAAQLLPPEFLSDSPAVYPAALRQESLSGGVKLELLIDERGDVETAALLEGSHPAFNMAALHAATRLRFKPARLADKPVPVRIHFSYWFQAKAAAETAFSADMGRVKGLVRTRGTRRSIPGATLYFSALQQISDVDVEGHFQMNLPKGASWVRVSAPGYKTRIFNEDVRAGEQVDVIYSLEPEVVNPYETVVRGERERTEVSRVTLHDEELRDVPGTMGDPFRVVMTLPGVSGVVSGVAYPVVRGTLPAATGYFIDGIRVPILFHLFLGPSVVQPDFIETMHFYPGAPPPQYGRLMGGVINGEISRTRDDRVHVTAYSDLINSGIFAEVPIEKTGTNITLAGRISYTGWLIALFGNLAGVMDPNTRLVLDFWDYQGRIEQKVGSGRLRLFAFGSADVVGAEATNENGATVLSSVIFHRADLVYTHPLGAGSLETGFTWGLDRVHLDAGGVGARLGLYLDDKSYTARAIWSADLAKQLRLDIGGTVEHHRASLYLQGELPQIPGQPLPQLPSIQDRGLATITGVWTQAIWKPTADWTVVPGMRLENYHLFPGLNVLAPEPRLTARYQLTEAVTLKGAAGLYHQTPITLVDLPAAAMTALRFGLQRGVQLDIGAEWKISSGLEVSADVYLNPLLRTIEIAPTDLFSGEPDTAFQQAVINGTSHGHSYGFELLVRHPLGGNWFGWISYSLQRSVRYRNFPRFDESGQVVGTDSAYVPFSHDQTHVLNAVLSYKLRDGWTVGGVLHFNTGRPEAGGLTSYTQLQGADAQGAPAWRPVELDKVDRLPPFFRIDGRISKTWIYDEHTLEGYLSVQNLTYSEEIVSFLYDAKDSVLKKSPVGSKFFLPMLGLKAVY